MLRLVLIVPVAVAAVLLLSACATPFRAPVRPPEGVLVTIYRAPLQIDMDATRPGPELGTASTYFIQDPIFTGINLAWGDASIEAAAREGGLETVRHADYARFSFFLGIFQKMTVRAYGE